MARLCPVSTFVRPDLFWSTDRVAEQIAVPPEAPRVSTGDSAADPHVRIVDCRFAVDGDAHTAYLAGHLPGAVHCDWSKDLVAPPPPSGHPTSLLPEASAFAATMARLGISNDTLVLGYDA